MTVVLLDLSHPVSAGMQTDLAGLPLQRLVNVPIIEHLTNLKDVPEEGACLIALPAPISGMASLPVRAVAVVPE